ncbi:hypothetical protein F5X68DRAFT_229593 [Plectosphaerella plurivora]|uniref:Uncharacterized protein n=1 Tax=Plectosphaerella plurivora TaxID=936078 RepID=A0A9P8VI70_9PEZI|nr:hypothetical protein F5X68DRAFT_229593 [Plectosphaerella plurivora]
MDFGLDDIPGDTQLKSAVTTRLAQRLGSTRNDYSGRLDSELTASSLVRYHDVKIVWTSILEDHLSFDRNKRILKIFEHKIWARNYLRDTERSVVPADVLQEVIRTLNLLFPSFKESTKSLLEAHGRLETIYGLGYCGHRGSLELADYKYWRAELEELQNLLNEQPRGLKQFWRPDREGRNLMVLALFWISGVMVFILTVVSSVFGAMSVAYARVQIRQANDAFDLAVAQACADPDIGKNLPQYCSK